MEGLTLDMAIPEVQAPAKKARVFFTGSTALPKGWGLCFDANRGTAADADGRRGRHVELPSSTNCMWFAGVTVRSYAAKATGQWIEIYLPGSLCQIAVGVDTVLDTTLLTCSKSGVDAGRFTQAGLPGKGTAKALQTVTGQKATLLDGTGSVNATALTGTGFVTGGVAAGDTVVIVAAEAGVTAGIYTVASVTNATTLVLTASASASALKCNYYILSAANPVCMAYLDPGPGQSGLQQWLSPLTGAAVDLDEWGATFVFGGVTIAANSTGILADGAEIGRKKFVKGMGTLTTSSYVVTVTNGIQADGATALATFSINAAAEQILLEWAGPKWKLILNLGTTLA